MKPTGNIKDTPFSDVLLKLYTEKYSGAVSFTRGKILKEVYFEDGEVKFAQSNSLDEKIGAVLVEMGKLTQGQLQYALDQSQKKNERIGTILVKAGFLKPKDLLEGIKHQIKLIVTEIFIWDEGEYKLVEGENSKSRESVKLKLPIGDLIIQGVRRITNPRQIMERVGSMAGKVTVNFEQNQAVSQFQLSDKEQEILALANGTTPISDICNTLPYPAIETCQILYALMAAGIILKVE